MGASSTTRTTEMAGSDRKIIRSPMPLFWLAIAAAPLFLNDFLFVVDGDVAAWLAVDYGSKLLVLALLFVPFANRRAAVAGESCAISLAGMLSLAVAALIAAFAWYRLVDWRLSALFADSIAFSYPPIESLTLYWIDLTFGLALTATAEELLFRKVFWHSLRPYLTSDAAVFGISSVAFALAHWAHGLAAIISAAVVGLVFMALYRRTRSIGIVIAVHYALLFSIFYR